MPEGDIPSLGSHRVQCPRQGTDCENMDIQDTSVPCCWGEFRFRLRFNSCSDFVQKRRCNGIIEVEVGETAAVRPSSCTSDRALVLRSSLVYCFVHELKRFLVLWAKRMTNWLGKTMVMCVCVGICVCVCVYSFYCCLFTTVSSIKTGDRS